MGRHALTSSKLRMTRNINADVYLYDVPDSTAEKGQISLFSLNEGSSSPIIQRRNMAGKFSNRLLVLAFANYYVVVP